MYSFLPSFLPRAPEQLSEPLAAADRIPRSAQPSPPLRMDGLCPEPQQVTANEGRLMNAFLRHTLGVPSLLQALQRPALRPRCPGRGGAPLPALGVRTGSGSDPSPQLRGGPCQGQLSHRTAPLPPEQAGEEAETVFKLWWMEAESGAKARHSPGGLRAGGTSRGGREGGKGGSGCSRLPELGMLLPPRGAGAVGSGEGAG